MPVNHPRNARSQRTRAAALDAAWHLLEERGPEATTMDAVAEAAGVTRRGLYLHFPSRADMLIALIHHVDDTFDLQASIEPVLAAPDALMALDEWATHLTDYHSRIRVAVDAVDRARGNDAGAAALWVAVMQAWHAASEQVAERLEREGKLAAGWTASAAAEALWALMLAFNPLWRALVEERGWSRDQFRAFLARLLRATFSTT